jgi:hypothetical protein
VADSSYLESRPAGRKRWEEYAEARREAEANPVERVLFGTGRRAYEAREARRHGVGGRMTEPCRVCGIPPPPGDGFTPEAYEALWCAIPDLRVKQRFPRDSLEARGWLLRPCAGRPKGLVCPHGRGSSTRTFADG